MATAAPMPQPRAAPAKVDPRGYTVEFVGWARAYERHTAKTSCEYRAQIFLKRRGCSKRRNTSLTRRANRFTLAANAPHEPPSLEVEP